MILTPIANNLNDYPSVVRSYVDDARLYDSSCSPEAKVIFIDKGSGFFLKSAAKGKLKREAELTDYYNSIGLSTPVLLYHSDERDWLLTEKIQGQDCIAMQYLSQPERLCDTLARQLVLLHAIDYSKCPVQNRTEIYLNEAKKNYRTGQYNASFFPDNWGYKTADEAYKIIESKGHLLKSDTLMHGDYCLPNIILSDWKFSGFIDLDCGGVGDKHIDLFWAIWTLFFNLKTDKYRNRFIDAYGRQNVDEELLKVVAAVEVFG